MNYIGIGTQTYKSWVIESKVHLQHLVSKRRICPLRPWPMTYGYDFIVLESPLACRKQPYSANQLVQS